MSLTYTLKKIQSGTDLTATESRVAFDEIFSGTVPEDQIAAFLTGLHEKGEATAEILGAALSMRAHMRAIAAPADAIDIVGTGGDKHSTLNISTAAVFVVAACGVPVAKHGNRAASSLSGASDVLQALGVHLEPSWSVLERGLDKIGVAFLFAPRHHPAMRHVAAVRKALGIRTIFNLLGPLTNPAHVKKLLIGAYAPMAMRQIAEVLVELDTEYALVVHGRDGMDEITTTGLTDALAVHDGMIATRVLDPAQLHIPEVDIDVLKGGDATFNAAAIRRLFDGETGPYRDIVAFNAAAALVIAKKVDTLDQGYHLALTALENGQARNKLEALVELTNAEE